MSTYIKNKCRKFHLLMIVLIFVSLSAQVFFPPDMAMTSEILQDEITGDEFAFTDAGLFPFKPTGSFELSFMPLGNLYLANDGALFQIADNELFKARNEGISWLHIDVERYAFKSVIDFSPNFDEDGKAFLGLWSYAYGGMTDCVRLSFDGGRTWRSPAMPLKGNVHTIAVSPMFAMDQTVYVALTDEAFRLWRSLDGGEHWQLMAYPSPTVPAQITKLVISPYFALDQTLYAHTYDNSKLWRSTDGGLTWQAIEQGLGTRNYIYDIAAIPLGNNEIALIAATRYALVMTFDGGASWYLISEREFRIIGVPVDFAWTLTLFGTDSDGHLWRTTDLGRSWHSIMPTNPVVNSLVLSPDYYLDQTLYVRANLELWVSHNNGQTWQRTADRPNVSLGEYNLDTIVSPQFDTDHTLFVYSQLWLLKSVDGGMYWHQVPLPAQGTGTNMNVALSPAYNQDQTLFVLIDSTIYKSTTGGQSWTPMSIPSCTATGFSFLRISPDYVNDNTIYIGIDGQGCGIYRSSNEGQTWQLMTGSLADAVTDFDISPQYPSDPTMFFTTYNEGIFRSDNGGSTWTNLTDPSFSPDFRVALSPNFSVDGTLFVGLSGISSGGAFRSEDRGETWTDISNSAMGGFVSAIAVSPNYPHDQTIIMGGNRGTPFISEDAGETWFSLDGTIAGDVGIHGKKLSISATYDDSRLSIFATTPKYGVYKYYWPGIPQVPNQFSIGIDPDDLGPTSAYMPLFSESDTSLRFTVAEEADWLAITPLTGTLPTTLVFTADPGGSTVFIDSMRTVVTAELHLSYQQKETYQIAVRAFLINSRVWLPLVTRNSKK